MTKNQIISEIIHAPNAVVFAEKNKIPENTIVEVIKQILPKIIFPRNLNFLQIIKDQQFFFKFQKLLQNYQEIISKIDWLENQEPHKLNYNQQSIAKKLTRAAIARKLQKTQQQIKKDQIFVRLTPKTQSCIQFMLSNRNFPRMQCKLSCNQHLEYLINYLTNKWIRGKMGFKVVLYPDAPFLKNMTFSQRQKSLKQPLDNYLMFTDIMACCNVPQNGALNLKYDILQIKKNQKAPKVISVNESYQKPIYIDDKIDISPSKVNETPNKFKSRPQASILPSLNQNVQEQDKSIQRSNQYMRQASIFNRNSNFFGHNQQSMLGSLGFNHFQQRRQELYVSHHSINYNDQLKQSKKGDQFKLKQQLKDYDFFSYHNEWNSNSDKNNDSQKKKHQQISQKSSKKQQNKYQIKKQQDKDKKLDNILSLIQKMQKQVQNGVQQSQNNNSNKAKDVKMVNIIKKKTIQ